MIEDHDTKSCKHCKAEAATNLALLADGGDITRIRLESQVWEAVVIRYCVADGDAPALRRHVRSYMSELANCDDAELARRRDVIMADIAWVLSDIARED